MDGNVAIIKDEKGDVSFGNYAIVILVLTKMVNLADLLHLMQSR